MSSEDQPHGRNTLDDLRGRLRRLHRDAGEPSTRRIATRIRKGNPHDSDLHISHMTVSRVLVSRRLPKLGNLVLVVAALDGPVDEFEDLWERIRDGTYPPERRKQYTSTLDIAHALDQVVNEIRRIQADLTSRGTEIADARRSLRGILYGSNSMPEGGKARDALDNANDRLDACIIELDRAVDHIARYTSKIGGFPP